VLAGLGCTDRGKFWNLKPEIFRPGKYLKQTRILENPGIKTFWNFSFSQIVNSLTKTTCKINFQMFKGQYD